jgi:uncharacterized protein
MNETPKWKQFEKFIAEMQRALTPEAKIQTNIKRRGRQKQRKTMAFFIVTMTHPDGEGWNTHLKAHIHYLQHLLGHGILRASGPLKGTDLRTGFLIITAASHADAQAIIAKDPFATEGLIDNLEITEWDPLFGIFAAESSGILGDLTISAASSRDLRGPELKEQKS